VEPYEHGPRVPRLLKAGPPLFLVGMLAYGAVVDGVQPDLELTLIAAAVTVALFLFAAALLLPRTYRSVRVDEDGLHVRGRLELPADRIGEVVPLDQGSARSRGWVLSRGRGTRIRERQNLYSPAGNGPAVVVQQLDVDGRWKSTWLLPTDDLDHLVEALTHARDTAVRR
jgi:hypothetical protein